jgi:hypothetical protein
LSVTESTGSYSQRTKENADWSDITLALAVDFNTYGETLTAQQAGCKDKEYLGNRDPREGVEDKYIHSAIPSNGHPDTENIEIDAADYYAKEIFKELQKKNKIDNIKLNIAGNGIYTFAKNNFATQEELNQYVYNLLSELQKLGVTISKIRSGGQTGIDEAGIIAAQRLGIPASVHAPKDFRFRDASGKDRYDKKAFLERFDQSPQQVVTDINTISNVSAAYGVELSNGSRGLWGKINQGWQQKNPTGIVAYRKYGAKPETFTAETVQEGWIGNPFSVADNGPKTVQ